MKRFALASVVLVLMLHIGARAEGTATMAGFLTGTLTYHTTPNPDTFDFLGEIFVAGQGASAQGQFACTASGARGP